MNNWGKTYQPARVNINVTPQNQNRITSVKAQAGTTEEFVDLKDPRLLEFFTSGQTSSGINVNPKTALANTSVFRCVNLISNVIGMLPLNIYKADSDKQIAKEHPIYRLLKHKPNDWQTSFEFRQYMQLKVLQHGNAYARIVWSLGEAKMLIPIDPTMVTVKQKDDWSIEYEYRRRDGSRMTLPPKEVLHLRDLSDDGISGMSRVEKAKEAIGLAIQAQSAAGRVFTKGVMAGGALSAPDKLSDTGYRRLNEQIESKSGVENANKWFILEEGLKAERWANTASDAQTVENRNHQVEEIARMFGVPRPFLMMDETSWGSGIEQLGMFLVQYGLQPFFTMWEQALARDLLSDDELDEYYFKFNEKALLRGTIKDQADFFTKALGSGGHMPWMTANQVRSLSDMPKMNDKRADKLQTANEKKQPESNKGSENEPN